MPWQPHAVAFPDIEAVVTDGLRQLLGERSVTDVHVGRRIPSPDRPPRMVIVNRDGGQDDGVTDYPRVRIRVWDLDDEAVSDLVHLVAALFPLLVGTRSITRAQKLSGPTEVPDSSGAAQRYLLFQLQTEGAPLS